MRVARRTLLHLFSEYPKPPYVWVPTFTRHHAGMFPLILTAFIGILVPLHFMIIPIKELMV